ncbi:MAG TPA: PAS domain S-box protein, partial [Bacillota bacterium]|nr:PAS domain S-box protein [Bacillota bacterium]
QDITERKQAEREQATLAALVENSPDAVVGETLEGIITSWNPGAERLFGYSAAEVLGRHISLLAPPEDPTDIPSIIRRVQRGEVVKRVAAQRIRKDGQRLTVSLAVCPIRAADGRIIGISKIAYDITQSRQIQQALRGQNRRLALLKAAAEALLSTTDPEAALAAIYDGMVEDFQVDGFLEFRVNSAGDHLVLVACKLAAGVTPPTRTRLPVGEGIAGQVARDRRPIVLADVQASGGADLRFVRELGAQAYACEPLIVSDRFLGTLSFLSCRRNRFDPEDQEFFQTLANYIAVAKERLRLSDELQQHASHLERTVRERTAQLLEANANLQTFTYTAAHDLRAPLRTIKNFTHFTMEEYGQQLGAAGLDHLQRVLHSAEQINSLLNDLLEYSKLNQAELRLEAVPLARAVAEALALLREDIHSQGAEIAVEHPLPAILGHPATVILVITNFVANALKFMPPGVPPRIRIWAEPVNALVRLGVQDNGIGIAPKDHGKLFQVFQRLQAKSAYPGTGLGLAIVRRAVERMGGRVGMASELGQGSCFWVDLQPAT